MRFGTKRKTFSACAVARSTAIFASHTSTEARRRRKVLAVDEEDMTDCEVEGVGAGQAQQTKLPMARVLSRVQPRIHSTLFTLSLPFICCHSS